MNRKLIYLGIVLLFVLHQDFWWWDDTTLVLGFIPIGLAYHALYSCMAAGLWYLALHYAWPEDAVRLAEGSDEAGDGSE